MGMRIVKLPNGKLACWSSIVDGFTFVDMDFQEAVQTCIREYDLGPKSALQKVQAGVDDDHSHGWIDRVADDGLDRWRNALCTLGRVHGLDKLRTELVEMGFPEWAEIVVKDGHEVKLLRPTPSTEETVK